MAKGSRLAIILPSRGLPFSQTVDEIVREAQSTGMPWKIYWSHGRGVPDCLNKPTEEALRIKSNELFWFVDDDMILPKGVLKALIEANKHAICVDYPASIAMGATVFDPDGRAFFSGNGCLLVKREVLESMQRPIWRSDVGWRIQFLNDHIEFTAGAQNPDKVYGQHDVNFGLRLYSQGRALYVLPNWTCGQRRLVSLGDPKTNEGGHKFREMRTFNPYNFFIIKSQHKRDAGENGQLVRVITGDDSEIAMPMSTANKLIKAGLVKMLGYAKFNNWDIEKERVLQ